MDLEDLAHVTLVAGAPRSGKTEFALDMLIAAMKRYGDANAVMTVSGRQIADMLGDRAIRELSAVSQARPVTTLSAVAFRLLTAARSAQGKPLPKLLNGAEQDVIIRKVLASHVEHRQHGDECATCDLLRVYFAVSEWSGLVRNRSLKTCSSPARPAGMASLTRVANACAPNGVSPSRCVRNTMRRFVQPIPANTVLMRRN